ncbi:uncharacterized protein LOC143244272 isoform X2 [Tachypleus tridentatus]|uniref:uncharacterized protein LOC143244272 isoform X2 n=1 Tax=Tachypleus tridentatus TaxID=6853 RepID=UPI003FD4AA53
MSGTPAEIHLALQLIRNRFLSNQFSSLTSAQINIPHMYGIPVLHTLQIHAHLATSEAKNKRKVSSALKIVTATTLDHITFGLVQMVIVHILELCRCMHILSKAVS